MSVPSKIGSNDVVREYKIYEDPIVFRPPVGDFSKQLLGLDIPILIPLPRDIISSGHFSNWNASTVHNLFVKVSCGSTYSNEMNFIESFPVPIKLYDTLPIYRQYNEPVSESRTSDDQRVLVELSLPVSSVGPMDEILAFVKVMTNPSNNKIRKNLRLNKITFQIKEILECHEGGLPIKKENKIFTRTKEFQNDENMLTTQGISHKISHQYPFDNDFLQMYTKTRSEYSGLTKNTDEAGTIITTLSIHQNKNLDDHLDGVPATHTQGFTTLGKLFSLRYEIIIKIKLAGSKDFDIRLPITVSAFDRVASNYLLEWILKECEEARNKFGKQMIHAIINTSNYEEIKASIRPYVPPPVVYNYRKADWLRLGYNGDAFGMNSSNLQLVLYID